jgi:hypothetical protein
MSENTQESYVDYENIVTLYIRDLVSMGSRGRMRHPGSEHLCEPRRDSK